MKSSIISIMIHLVLFVVLSMIYIEHYVAAPERPTKFEIKFYEPIELPALPNVEYAPPRFEAPIPADYGYTTEPIQMDDFITSPTSDSMGVSSTDGVSAPEPSEYRPTWHTGIGVGGKGVGRPGKIIKKVEPPPPPEPVEEPAPIHEPVYVAASIVSMPRPKYPQSAIDRGIQGVVKLEVSLGGLNDIIEIRVVKSSGKSVLDEAAIEAIRHWTFRSATLDDVGVASVIAIPPIRFRLD